MHIKSNQLGSSRVFKLNSHRSKKCLQTVRCTKQWVVLFRCVWFNMDTSQKRWYLILHKMTWSCNIKYLTVRLTEIVWKMFTDYGLVLVHTKWNQLGPSHVFKLNSDGPKMSKDSTLYVSNMSDLISITHRNRDILYCIKSCDRGTSNI